MFLVKFIPFFFGLLACSAHAAAPSGETWFTLSTKNFRVHHTAPLEIYARHFAFSLERSLPALEQSLSWKAPSPIDIVIMDPSDSANGLAANFPNTHIEAFAAPFEHDSPLGYYIDWAEELATHELAHIIANDSGLGYYLTLRKIFGSWVKPNGLQPSWLIEGLAVYKETSLSAGGRGRSPWTDALLREAIHQQKLTAKDYTSIDRLNDGNPWWPGGSAAYLLGYTIQAAGTAHHPNLPGEVSITNAGLIPFMPNRAAVNVSGTDWYDLWSRAETRLKERYAGENQNYPEPCFLTQSGRFTGGHALSPDGWIYFHEEDFERGTYFSRVRSDAPCGNASVERLYRKERGGPSQTAVNHDGSVVAFSAFDDQKFERFYSDLYLWRRNGKKTEQITKNLRARDPAFSGDHLFYVAQNPDTTQSIRRRHLPTQEDEVAFTSLPLERISGLHSRGEELLFSLHDNKGQEKILSIPTVGGKPDLVITELTGQHRHFEKNPFLAADGRIWFALFNDSEEQASRQDVFVFDPKTNQTKRAAGIRSGYVDRPIPLEGGKELLVQAYHLKGADIARIPLASLEHQPQIDLHEFLTGQAPKSKNPPSELELAEAGVIQPYSATKTAATSLWPQYWLPELTAAEEGVLIGASTSGNDPLEYHFYSLLVQYDSRARFPLYQAYYRNRSSTTNLHFQASQTNNYFVSRKAANRNTTYSLEATIPFSGKTFFSIGGAFQERQLFERTSQNMIVYQAFSYHEVGRTPAALDPNFGESFRTYVGLYPKARYESFFADIRPTAGLFFPGVRPSHSIGLVARGGYSTNRLLASNYYQGGGLSVLDAPNFVVRGYPIDSLLGQRIATANFSYTLPLAHPFRGWGTNPLFLRSFGLRATADAGTANYVSLYRVSDKAFRGYLPSSMGRHVLTGFGLDLVARGSVFYHIPLHLSTGVHYGLKEEFGGGLVYFLGLSAGQFGTLGR